MTLYLRKQGKSSCPNKELKKKGKGTLRLALTSDELNTLYEKGLLGTRNPEVLLNTLWLNNTMQFGLRGYKEHRDMCWGDVKFKETADGEEYTPYSKMATILIFFCLHSN